MGQSITGTYIMLCVVGIVLYGLETVPDMCSSATNSKGELVRYAYFTQAPSSGHKNDVEDESFGDKNSDIDSGCTVSKRYSSRRH